MRRNKIHRAFRYDTKSSLVAYLLMIPPFGFWGVHKFYLNQPILGLLYLITGGFMGFGLLYDLLTIPEQVMAANARMLGYTPADKSFSIQINTDRGVNLSFGDKQNYAYAEVVEVEREEPKKSLEARVIEAAEAIDGGRVTIKDLIKQGFSLDDAKDTLTRLAQEGVCEEVIVSGVKYYCF